MGKGIPGSSVTVVDDEGIAYLLIRKGILQCHLICQHFSKDIIRSQNVRRKRKQVNTITGDLAHVDDDGYFWFEGRRDDIIISSGYTIGPLKLKMR